jgi:hypothetical protein
MQNEVNASGVANDISNRNYPNRFFGYGRPQLNRVLRLRKPPSNSSDESADVLDFGGRITLVKDHVQVCWPEPKRMLVHVFRMLVHVVCIFVHVGASVRVGDDSTCAV